MAILTTQRRAHFVFIPLMAPGHVIPAMDTALLLCTKGAVCSIVATPSTAGRVRPCVEHYSGLGLDVRLLEFPLDFDRADNLDSIPMRLVPGYFRAVALLRAPVEERLRTLTPEVTCVVSDMCHPWTSPLAASLGVPRLSFFPTCALCALCEHNVEKLGAYDRAQAEVPAEAGDTHFEKAVVVVPVLERTLELTREQTPRFLREPAMGTLGKDIDQAHADGDGMILNTFFELEPDYVRGLAAAWGKTVWTVGPVSSFHDHQLSLRGEAAADDDCLLEWLDGKDPGSVVYASFGTIAPPMEPEQLLELGLGLADSGHPFIWVLSKGDQLSEQISTAAAGRGRIVTAWVPQLRILSHAAVGCFLTHGGWNSLLETITAGKPVVAWPRLPFSDHHVNAKMMVVDVLGIGLSIGPEEVVRREVFQAAVTAVLDGGEEGQERRRRARALSHKATAAMQPGGSSHDNLCDLVKCFTPI